MGEYRHTDTHTLTALSPLRTYNHADFNTNVPKACTLVQQPTPSFFTMYQKKTKKHSIPLENKPMSPAVLSMCLFITAVSVAYSDS